VKIIGILHTVKNLGDHGREVSIPIEPRSDETVLDFFIRAQLWASSEEDFVELRQVVREDNKR
jgi:hypothetical protein